MLEKTWRKYIDVNLKHKLNENYHLGHILLESFKKKCPEDISQINGATDERETYGSLYRRTVRLARSLTNFGCKPGDVVALAGANHLDLGVPFFAGMISGLPIYGADPAFKKTEIKSAMNICRPKIVFCDYTIKKDYIIVAKELGFDLTVVTFCAGDLTMQNFIDKYDDDMPISDFKPPTFNPNEIIAWLISTSGTTGVPKFAAIKQKTVPAILSIKINALISRTLNDGEEYISLLLSSIQWISAYPIRILALLAKICLLTTSKKGDIDHIIDIINKYKPNSAPGSPSTWALIMQRDKICDLTCFEVITAFGAKVNKDIKEELKKRMHPNAILLEGYGQTETVGTICLSTPGVTPLGSCGKMETGVKVKLVDANGKEITKPNIPGELLYRGAVFDGYYNNPEETAKVFTKDGWLKTGDQFYRDESHNYFFVERLKMIIKYRSFHIVPTELEDLIRQHPSVQDVCVTSIDHPTDQQWPVAVVVKRPGSNVTAQDIKDIIAKNLSDAKKLRGGVVFVDELPLTASGKVARMVIRTTALQQLPIESKMYFPYERCVFSGLKTLI